MTTPKPQNVHGVPVAIIIAGLFISGTLILGARSNDTGTRIQKQSNTQRNILAENFRLPEQTDHMRGNSQASISIIEFSDFECPFCARLHPTLVRVVTENTDVEWIYRHFPLSSHSNAFEAAVASECMAQLGGNDAFWLFVDSAFENQREIGEKFYKELAESVGISADVFNNCRKDIKISSEVQADLDEVIAVGGRGTPFVVVVGGNGKSSSFSGALSFEQINNLLAQVRNN